MARMKVLLIEDVPDLGEAGEVYTVAGGYARNFLMPRGMAMVASKGALKQAEEIRQAGIRRRAIERENAEAQASVITNQRLLFTANAGENDRLYGSVTTGDMAERLAEAVGFEIDRRKITLQQPVRELGIYAIPMRLMSEVTTEFTIGVVREGEDWAAAEARRRAKEAAAEAAAEEERQQEAAIAAAALSDEAGETAQAAADGDEEADDESESQRGHGRIDQSDLIPDCVTR